MDNLDKYRDRIDIIDKEIVDLFIERLKIAEEIAVYKQKNNLPIYHKGREEQVIKKVKENVSNQRMLEPIESLFKHIMELSKNFQIEKQCIDE